MARHGTGKSVGHDSRLRGYSHAINIDEDGINPPWVIKHVTRRSDVMYYIIWDVRVWSTSRFAGKVTDTTFPWAF